MHVRRPIATPTIHCIDARTLPPDLAPASEPELTAQSELDAGSTVTATSTAMGPQPALASSEETPAATQPLAVLAGPGVAALLA